MKIKTLTAALSLGLGAFLTSAVFAANDNGIQYNYGELRYIVDAELDNLDTEDGDGFGFGGSFRIDELIYVIADYEALDYDRGIDTTVLQVGAGVILPFQKIDFIGEAALVDGDVDTDVGDSSDTGFRITGGARTYVMPKLELRGSLTYIDVEDDDTFATIAGDYFFNKSLSLNVSKDIAADVDRFSIGVRYYFGE